MQEVTISVSLLPVYCTPNIPLHGV